MLVFKFKPLALISFCLLLTNCTTTRTVHEKIEIDSRAQPSANDGFVETAQAGDKGDSLFVRLGGKARLTEFTNRFVNALSQNPLTAKSMHGDLDKFKTQLASQLCELSGGPCHYDGPSMKAAHAPLAISAEQWKVMGQIFIVTLRDMHVDKKERMELANLVAPFKHDIVK
jgi:hemoglobin